MPAQKGEAVTFRTVGGNTVKFVHEGGPYGYGAMTCNGCKVSDRVKVEEANQHAGECRAQ